MSNMFPSWPTLGAFLLASFVLAVTPGPGVIYIVTRSLAQGRRSGVLSVMGVALGNFGNAILAAVGLGAVLAISTTAFSVIKYAGAGYLVYLGIRAFRAAKPTVDSTPPQALQDSRVFRDGVLVALLNPKTAVFFAAFLPQFMSAHSPPIPQSILLGAIFVSIAALTDTVYALTASAVAPVLNRAEGTQSTGRLLTGGAFVGLGLFTVLSDSRSIE